MPKDTPWDKSLSVTCDAEGLTGHAGAVLLRKLADQCGLTAALSGALARIGKFPLADRGMVLVSMAVAIVLGATSMSDIAVLDHQEQVFGPPPSDTTVRRTLELADDRTLGKIARARAKIRAHVWGLIAATPAGFPWLTIAGKTLAGWLVIDMDATLVTAHSDKEGAAPTFKKGYGFHPLGAWLANTAESLAMLLRPGNAGSNTVTDHISVLSAALAQVPAGWRSRLLVRVDGAGATIDLVKHLLSLRTRRRTVLFTCGWMITESDEAAIKMLPAAAWQAAVDQDGTVQKKTAVAEITRLMGRAGNWPPGLRWIVRRTKPSRRQAKNLTAFEKATGWRYSIIVTNIPDTGIAGVPGSHHPQFIDVLHREHAVVEDRVRTNKAMGLRNLPSKTWQVNKGWVLAANIAADLDAWCRLLGLYDCEDLKDAEPGTLRYRLWSLPARLVRHARKRVLKISATWPWKEAFTTCWQRLCALPAPA
jgi:Transposase DDE domain group 1